MLNSFAESTCLHVNYHKSNIYPINVLDQKMEILANTFHCKIGSMPFTYLGLPLGLKKPNLVAFLPLIQKIEKRLATTSIFLSRDGRLQMVDVGFSSLPTYYMCILKLLKSVIKHIDKIRRHCLWRGADINAKKPPQDAWKSVCKPKTQGGLGVINIEMQNKALLMKNLHKIYNRAGTPWINIIWANHYHNNTIPSERLVGSFWWRDILKIRSTYKELVRVEIGDGRTTLLWHDNWDGICKSEIFPELWSFASNKDITIHQARTAGIHEMFHTPLSVEAFQQLHSLQDSIANLPKEDQRDRWLCTGTSSLFTSHKAYVHMAGDEWTHPIYFWIWRTKCQPKHKVFFWLLIKNRLNTRSFLRRRSMLLDSYTCENCILQHGETILHLFLRCNFARRCCLMIGITPSSTTDLVHALLRIRVRLKVPWRMEIIIIMSWCIWRSRNNWIFNEISPTVEACREMLKGEMRLICHRIKSGVGDRIRRWIQHSVT
jgi:hypothetical protein